MSNKDLDKLFKNSEQNLDIYNPNLGHEERFLNKLNKQKPSEIQDKKPSFFNPFIGIAASITLLVSFFVFTPKEDDVLDLASISPEMAKTESLFMVSLTNELKKLNSEEMPEYQELIVDTLFKIKLLEEDYNQLILGLNENPKDSLIIKAMILNFQSRIDLLENTIYEIEELKKSNTNQIII